MEPQVTTAGECELHGFGSAVQHRQAHQHQPQHGAARLHRGGSPRGQGLSSLRLQQHALDVDGELQPLHREASGSGPLAGTPSHAAEQPDCHSAHIKVFLEKRPLSFATTVLLAGALCVHSILEGMALGAQQSMKDTEDIMIAIAAHKGLAAYALGASIVESKASASKFWTVVRARAGCRLRAFL
jgi:zinc transporter ZupT